MAKDEDIRWKQRLQNYLKALKQLSNGIQISQSRSLNDLEKQGLIQGFEYTHELAWNVIKDFLEYQGTTSMMGSRDATREAFRRGLIVQGDIWMDMIKSRNLSTHTYNEKTAEALIDKIIRDYFAEFLQLADKMNAMNHD